MGRGAFAESYPLFGHRLEDYHALFEEKLQMLLELREHAVVDWQGRLTQTLPLFVAPLSGPARFRRLVELYRQSAADAGTDRARRRPPGGKPPAGH
ncbi:hypothetical protein FFF93_014590 [Arthrobacter sp. KBS0702]|uniref:hypothetical protein n=1 Tax=Arthrobacter sp. KBS0702 TaxID=2578107 RepID=UPI00110F6370|nr:hypothetical protein [Arthrobacter sp. KBS0702]QDW30867.1 hypothetical protein FFF93_014590 [Arthrobacter sp. KBS0702]